MQISLYRTNRAVSCTKPAAKSSAASFSFKSDERAERRKEVKQHAFVCLKIEFLFNIW